MTATAAQAGCRLALVLALDVSSSVDQAEYNLQRIGLASALNAPEIRHAILQGASGDVALAVYEWSGFFQQKLHLDWTLLRSEADIDQAVLSISSMTRSHDNFPTSVGQALGYGATVLERAPACARKVIDLSGDGINNHGFGPEIAYRNFPLEEVTVNGLVILSNKTGVVEYYRDYVLKGSNAFLVIANGFEDFRDSMTQKLYREINDLMTGDLEGAEANRGG